MNPFNPYEHNSPRPDVFLGSFKGFVRRNNDPEKRGRIRCYCPQVMGPEDSEEFWLDWAEGKFPWMGGINTTDFGPPFTKDEQLEMADREFVGVWLEFQNGNPDFPVWNGTFSITPIASEGDTLGTSGGVSIPGGGVIGSPLPDGSDDSALNPPQITKSREIRLRAPKGRDIVILVDGGGSIIIGPSGVFVNGVQVAVNGKQILASATEYAGGE